MVVLSPPILNFSVSSSDGRNNLSTKYNPFLRQRFWSDLPSSMVGRRGSVVAMMGKREEEMKEIRSKTTEEIKESIIDLKGELLHFRFMKNTGKHFQRSDVDRITRRIARMFTVKREREIVEGIKPRLSRKMEKRWLSRVEIRPPPYIRRLQEEAATSRSVMSEFVRPHPQHDVITNTNIIDVNPT